MTTHGPFANDGCPSGGDEATNELTKIEEDGEEDEDSWDIV